MASMPSHLPTYPPYPPYAAASVLEEVKKQKRKFLAIAYTHYFLHAKVRDGFATKDFPKYEGDLAQQTKYKVSEIRKFLYANSCHMVKDLTDLEGGQYQLEVVANVQ